jgi:biopolymer transport protein ExbD
MNFLKNIRGERLSFQMAPMVDFVFLILIFFLSTYIYYDLEMGLDITVPRAVSSTSQKRMPGEIIINIAKDGLMSVNQKIVSPDDLEQMLMKISRLYEGQPVIIRGDGLTYHKDIVRVLDICAKSGIWNISFATVRGNEE